MRTFFLFLSALVFLTLVVFATVPTLAQEFTFAPTTAEPPPPGSDGYDPYVVLKYNTKFPPIGGSGIFNGTALNGTKDPAAKRGDYLDLNISSPDSMQVYFAAKVDVDPIRLFLPETEVFYRPPNAALKQPGETQFTVQFLDPPTTESGHIDLGPTTTTLRGEGMRSIDIARKFKELLFKEQRSFFLPWLATSANFKGSVPDPAPTQPLYTPVPTVNEVIPNITSFGTVDEDSQKIVAIVVSVVIGTIMLTVGVLAFKSYMEKKKLQEKPSTFKWQRDQPL